VSPLRVEFHPAPEPAEPVETPPGERPPPPPPPPPSVASATWHEGRLSIDCDDDGLREAITHAFRRIPLVVDDASLRSAGTRGEVVLQPGDLEWFREVALIRAPAETGLIARFVPGVTVGGYDPAANYRRFPEQMRRLIEREGT
jgi:hypothetical protein